MNSKTHPADVLTGAMGGALVTIPRHLLEEATGGSEFLRDCALSAIRSIICDGPAGAPVATPEPLLLKGGHKAKDYMPDVMVWDAERVRAIVDNAMRASSTGSAALARRATAGNTAPTERLERWDVHGLTAIAERIEAAGETPIAIASDTAAAIRKLIRVASNTATAAPGDLSIKQEK